MTRLVRLTIALALALSMLPGLTGTAVADPDTPYEAIFPWVPNGAMLGSMGPFYGAITLTNLEEVAVTLYYQVSGYPAASVPLGPAASITLSAAQMGVPAPGGMVRAYSRLVADPNQQGWIVGALKQTAPVTPESLALQSKTSGAHLVVDGYSGFTQNDPSSTQVLPIVQTNSGWNTVIHIANVGDTTMPAQVGLRSVDDQITYTAVNVTPGGVLTINLLDFGAPTEFVGAAHISTTQDGKLLAIAERHKPSTNMLLINPSSRRCSIFQAAPLILKNFNSWNTGISVYNDSFETNQVTITYYSAAGAIVGTSYLTIPAGRMDFDYQPAGGADDGFVGSAVILGTQPLCAMVDQVKYTGGGGDVGHAMSYAGADDGLISTQEVLYLPLAQKGNPATGMGDTTGIQVFNSGDTPATVWVGYYSANGAEALWVPLVVPARGSTIAYAMSLDLPDGFQGWAGVVLEDGSGPIYAVSNNVNYAVGFDGSVSFAPILAY